CGCEDNGAAAAKFQCVTHGLRGAVEDQKVAVSGAMPCEAATILVNGPGKVQRERVSQVTENQGKRATRALKAVNGFKVLADLMFEHGRNGGVEIVREAGLIHDLRPERRKHIEYWLGN